MYTTCEVGKRRTVNHTRARSLASPGRAGPWPRPRRGEARRGAARRGAVRCGRPAGRAVRCACACACAAGRDVQVRCGAAWRGAVRCDGYFAVDSN